MVCTGNKRGEDEWKFRPSSLVCSLNWNGFIFFQRMDTLPKTNIAPENATISIGNVTSSNDFQGSTPIITCMTHITGCL